MKKISMFLSLAALILCACGNFDAQISDLQKQLDQLKEDQTSISSTLEELDKALKENAEKAIDIVPISDKAGVIGYTVTFKDGSKVNLFNQPYNITIDKDGDTYYWKADGDWLTSKDGSKIKVMPESSVPQFKIEDDILKVSFDKGASFEEVGNVGNKYVLSVEDSAEGVTITLVDGQTITIPKESGSEVQRVVANLENLPICAGGKTTVKYTIENANDNTTLYALAQGGWKATVKADSLSGGTITFTAPESGEAGNVTLILSDNSGATFMQPVTFDVLPQVEPYDICAYHVPYGDLITNFQFTKMMEAGVNIAHSYNKNQWAQAMKASAGTGLQLVGDLQDYVYKYTTMSDDDYKAMIDSNQQLVEDVKFYQQAENLWGYTLIDEPRDSLFVKIGYLSDRIRQLDPDSKLYVNLWGDQMCDESLIPFIRDSRPDFISFDQYPCTYTDVNDWWWGRLENVYRISKQYNIPWWGFAASTDVGNSNFGNGCCIPTEASMKLQMYGNILYGAAALEYFTWVLFPGGTIFLVDQHYAPVSTTGEITDTYYMAQAVDKEINARKFIFDGGDIKWIRHTRNSVPQGCKKLATSDDPLMPECIYYYRFHTAAKCLVEMVENNGHQYLIFFNKMHTSTAKVFLELTKDLMQVDTEGSFVPFELSDEGEVEIGAGDALILVIK